MCMSLIVLSVLVCVIVSVIAGVTVRCSSVPLPQISDDPNNMETDAQAMAEGQQQLQNKLRELQNKKLQLDMRLQELQLIHGPPESSRNNGTSARIHSLMPRKTFWHNCVTEQYCYPNFGG